MDRMEEVLARLGHGQEEDLGEVESASSLTMIREAGLMVEGTLLRVAEVSCRTMPVESQEAVGMRVAAHLVPVAGF